VPSSFFRGLFTNLTTFFVNVAPPSLGTGIPGPGTFSELRQMHRVWLHWAQRLISFDELDASKAAAHVASSLDGSVVISGSRNPSKS
jgi:hypothetical protein